MRAGDRGDDAATVDVADQDHRHVGAGGKTHIGDVARPEVDLGRRTRAFDDDEVGALADLSPGIQHGLHQLRLEQPGSRAPWPGRTPCPARRPGCRCRSAASAAPGSCGWTAPRRRRSPAAIARGRSRRRRSRPGISATAALFDMFCGLNGRTLMPRFLRGAAEPGDEHRLADIRAGALQHDRPRHASAPPARPSR